jgi:hypothetical protein
VRSVSYFELIALVARVSLSPEAFCKMDVLMGATVMAL